jgi:hypothetical protein
MGIRYEKRNLMAMIPSPIITARGYWRWFITFAPADNYESLLFETVMRDDAEQITWDERRQQVIS